MKANRPGRVRALLVIASCCAASTAIALPDAVAADCSWTVLPVQGPDEIASLSSVTTLSDTDVWAVGSYSGSGEFDPTKPLIEHYDGTSWSVVPSPHKGERELLDVTSLRTDDVWAVGARLPSTGVFGGRRHNKALVNHWNGTSWKSVPVELGEKRDTFLTGVSAAAPDDIWAVGHYVTRKGAFKALAMHYDGTKWRVVPGTNEQGIARDLLAVVALDDSDTWAVGSTQPVNEAGYPLIEHWDGTGWEVVPFPSIDGGLTDVTAAPDGTLWAVGNTNDYSTSHGFALHYSGGTWTLVPTESTGGAQERLTSIDASDGRLLTVGWYVAPQSNTLQPLAESWTGSQWSAMQAPGLDDQGGFLLGVAAGETTAWAVGGSPSSDREGFRFGTDLLIERLVC
jgi:hypothetical protein